MKSAAKDRFARVTISLHPEERDVLCFVAFKRGMSVARLVRELIQELLEAEEDIQEGLKAMQDEADTIDWETFKRQRLALQD